MGSTPAVILSHEISGPGAVGAAPDPAQHPQEVSNMAKRSVEERFWEKVDQSGSCWNWLGARSQGSYGHFRFNGKVEKAHRVSFLLAGGTLVPGMHLDHLCRNPACVRPAHLEQVTPRVNILRGVGAAAQAARRTHCPQGHEYTEENTYREPNNPRHRECFACMRAKSKVHGMLEDAPIIPCPICGTVFRARKQGTNKSGRQLTCSYPCSVELRYGRAASRAGGE